jgi:hypothetical protein
VPTAPYLDDFERWRQLAEQARTLANRMGNEGAREMMLRIAADYNKLAVWAAVKCSEPIFFLQIRLPTDA